MFAWLKDYNDDSKCNDYNKDDQNAANPVIARLKILVGALYSFQLRKHLVIGQFNFNSVFFYLSLVTISQQISHDSGIFVKTT